MNPFKALLDLIIPRECHVCGDTLPESDEFVCGSCMSRLPLTLYENYWADKSGPNTDLNPMERRFAGQLPLVHACAPFFYERDTSLATLIHDFKYRGFSRLAAVLGRKGASLLQSTGLFDGVDLLVPVPLHWTKSLRRGYNQTEMIAQGISEVTGIPVGKELRASRAHRSQTSLSHEARMANTANLFSACAPGAIRGKHLMIVDDICTTGATILSAGEALVRACENDLRISVFTLGVV